MTKFFVNFCSSGTQRLKNKRKMLCKNEPQYHIVFKISGAVMANHQLSRQRLNSATRGRVPFQLLSHLCAHHPDPMGYLQHRSLLDSKLLVLRPINYRMLLWPGIATNKRTSDGKWKS
jgi:hypothetical protein